jgi:hypothetical protein
MTPGVLPSRYQNHQAELSFANPYEQPISGQIRIDAPEGWTITPRVDKFSIGPGATWVTKLNITFPYNASAGLKKLNVSMKLDAREGAELEIPAFFYLELAGVAFDLLQTVAGDGSLEIQQVITNNTDKSMSFYCFVHLPDQATQTRMLVDLKPGATAVKVFRFNKAAGLRGKTMRAGLREVGGPSVLNQTAVIR